MTSDRSSEGSPGRAESEVVELVSSLIRFDTSNTGELETTKGERECALWVQARLEEVGYETEYVESGAPGRGNVFARLKGADPARGTLLMHGHLDVVPAEPADWSVHPFSGAVEDGYVWGRGAVDMKDMCGMMLALARQFKAEGTVPRATSCSRSSRTRRPAASTGASGSSTTGPICSRVSPRPWAK
ncbi:metallopeptidase [Prescottella equi]|nr:metallopeptidase [Prescottella equi]